MKRATRSERPAPMFSIPVPSYNHGAYLGAALASPSAQTVGDFEVDDDDDGSTDASLAVATPAAARDPRIRVIRQAYGGVAFDGECIRALRTLSHWHPTARLDGNATSCGRKLTRVSTVCGARRRSNHHRSQTRCAY